MKISTRRVLHEDRMTYHDDVILSPNGAEMARLDKLLPISVQSDVVYDLQGELRLDDTFRFYFRLTPHKTERKNA